MNGFCIIGLFPKVNKRTNNTLCFPSKTSHKHAFCIRTIVDTKGNYDSLLMQNLRGKTKCIMTIMVVLNHKAYITVHTFIIMQIYMWYQYIWSFIFNLHKFATKWLNDKLRSRFAWKLNWGKKYLSKKHCTSDKIFRSKLKYKTVKGSLTV